MNLKIQYQEAGHWYDKAYTQPKRAIKDLNLYRQYDPKTQHRIIDTDTGRVVFQ
jgi:hypothetical protein